MRSTGVITSSKKMHRPFQTIKFSWSYCVTNKVLVVFQRGCCTPRTCCAPPARTLIIISCPLRRRKITEVQCSLVLHHWFRLRAALPSVFKEALPRFVIGAHEIRFTSRRELCIHCGIYSVHRENMVQHTSVPVFSLKSSWYPRDILFLIQFFPRTNRMVFFFD